MDLFAPLVMKQRGAGWAIVGVGIMVINKEFRLRNSLFMKAYRNDME